MPSSSKLSHKNEQLNWRLNKQQVDVHQALFNLSEQHIALLDCIAIAIYQLAPHCPPSAISHIYPGRQAAIEYLLNSWLAQDPILSKQLDPIIQQRKEMSAFWRSEASW